MKEIPIIIKISGPHKRSKQIKRKISKGRKGWLGGYCEARAKPAGFKVWINSRQTDREIVDSFFHEMTHVLLRIRFSRKPFNVSKRHQEQLCEWIGYLAKQQFADMMPRVFGLE